MNKKEKSNLIADLLESANGIAILPNKVAGSDAFFAGLGLYYALKASDKKVSIIYPGRLPEKAEELIDPKEIISNVSKKDLIVSIDYSDTPAAKVHYSTEGGILYLRISPVERDFDVNRVKTSVSGEKYDIYITIGAQALDDFGQTYRELQKDIYAAKIINLDNTDRNFRFGHFNIVDASADSLCTLVLSAAVSWGIQIGKESAKAFLQGVAHRVRL